MSATTQATSRFSRMVPAVNRTKPSKTAPPRAAAALPGQIRLIGGRWKRHLLPVPDRPGLRPTPDRVRETLFNWLGQDMSGWRCLDAFAGTGALGFEAASRGASQVQLVERDATLCAALRATQAKLGIEAARIDQSEALAWMRRQPSAAFELVFLDPPFEADLFVAAIEAAARLVVDDGWLYLEADRRVDDATLAAQGLVLHRHLKAGQVHAHLLRRVGGRSDGNGDA